MLISYYAMPTINNQEVLRSEGYTLSSDVWSFGVVMWEVFTKGMTPYAGQTPDEIAVDVCILCIVLRLWYRMRLWYSLATAWHTVSLFTPRFRPLIMLCNYRC